MRLAFALTLSLLALPLAAQDADEWDVNAAHGPTFDVSFETSEGTWMTVDVSPDGQTLVFDLLGDLYLLPIEGGKAKSLTSGMAWDMQPQFSHDGKSLAFSSDRLGKSKKSALPSTNCSLTMPAPRKQPQAF